MVQNLLAQNRIQTKVVFAINWPLCEIYPNRKIKSLWQFDKLKLTTTVQAADVIDEYFSAYFYSATVWFEVSAWQINNWFWCPFQPLAPGSVLVDTMSNVYSAEPQILWELHKMKSACMIEGEGKTATETGHSAQTKKENVTKSSEGIEKQKRKQNCLGKAWFHVNHLIFQLKWKGQEEKSHENTRLNWAAIQYK